MARAAEEGAGRNLSARGSVSAMAAVFLFSSPPSPSPEGGLGGEGFLAGACSSASSSAIISLTPSRRNTPCRHQAVSTK